MIARLRFLVALILPASLKWWLVRKLPFAVTFAGKFFQGINPIWETDPEFRNLFMHIKDRVLMDRRRAYVLYNVARSVASKNGDIVEMGVYQGGSAYLMLQATDRKKDYYGFDTFGGLPVISDDKDPYWKQGDMGETSLAEVEAFLSDSRAHLIEGIFPDSLPEMPVGRKFSLVHIDGDLYQTTFSALQNFYGQTVEGGIILINDYGFLSSPGVRAAVDAFFVDQPENPIYLPSGQCLIIKH